jgi:predicted metal-dependent phosphoesterase TrpH
MHFSNPFAVPGRWFKGSLHIHSSASDGDLTPDEVIGWYRKRGYHFLALTDHGVWSEGRSVSDGFLTISGVELDGIDPQAGLFHLVGLGARRPSDPGAGAFTSMQEVVRNLRAAGGLVIMAHPYWSGQMSRDLLELKGCIGLEIYNGGCEVDDAKGFSIVHWDDLLAAGRRLWGLAVDDAHWRDGDHDAGLGWVWVKAPDLTQKAILHSLEEGLFYASSGPRIYDLLPDVAAGEVHVQCSPAALIDFVGNGKYSRRFTALPGEVLTEASYRLRKGQQYVRVACQDTRGRWAWSNPIFLT